MAEHNKDSVLGNLGKVGSSLGKVGGKVVKKVRADLTSEENAEGLRKFKADASKAAGSIKKAGTRGDYVGVGKDFARDAGSFLKTAVGSVKSAVNDVKDSEDAGTAKSAFASVVESSRDKLDDTVDKVRAKKAEHDVSATDTTESTNGAGDDIIEGEVIPTPDNPQEPRA